MEGFKGGEGEERWMGKEDEREGEMMEGGGRERWGREMERGLGKGRWREK